MKRRGGSAGGIRLAGRGFPHPPPPFFFFFPTHSFLPSPSVVRFPGAVAVGARIRPAGAPAMGPGKPVAPGKAPGGQGCAVATRHWHGARRGGETPGLLVGIPVGYW